MRLQYSDMQIFPSLKHSCIPEDVSGMASSISKPDLTAAPDGLLSLLTDVVSKNSMHQSLLGMLRLNNDRHQIQT